MEFSSCLNHGQAKTVRAETKSSFSTGVRPRITPGEKGIPETPMEEAEIDRDRAGIARDRAGIASDRAGIPRDRAVISRDRWHTW